MDPSSRLSVCLAIVMRNSSNIRCARSISRQRTTPWKRTSWVRHLESDSSAQGNRPRVTFSGTRYETARSTTWTHKSGLPTTEGRLMTFLRGDALSRLGERGTRAALTARPLSVTIAAGHGGRRRAVEQRDECAALHLRDHSITSSARASNVGGTSRPRALAILWLITSSYFTLIDPTQ